MISPTEIQAVCDTIVREFAPEQVILFGSYAYGTPTEHSDVDLLVVMPIPEAEPHRQEKAIQKRIPHQFRMHLLVRSPEEITTRVAQNDWFLREILEKGAEQVLQICTDVRHTVRLALRLSVEPEPQS